MHVYQSHEERVRHQKYSSLKQGCHHFAMLPYHTTAHPRTELSPAISANGTLNQTFAPLHQRYGTLCADGTPFIDKGLATSAIHPVSALTTCPSRPPSASAPSPRLPRSPSQPSPRRPCSQPPAGSRTTLCAQIGKALKRKCPTRSHHARPAFSLPAPAKAPMPVRLR